MELRKLREGAGGTHERLKRCGALLSALGTSSPKEARQRITHLLEEQQPADQAAALAVDLALHLDQHLQREPTDREQSRLGERRAAYAEVRGRDVKTLARWSDQAAVELRSRIFDDVFTGHLWVVGAVQDSRLLGVSFGMEETNEDEDPRADIPEDWNPRLRVRKTVDYDNPCGEPSMPCLLYALPRDWQPATLTLAVRFLDQPPPDEVHAVHAPTFFEMSFASRRERLVGGNAGLFTCRFARPRRDMVYGLWW